MQAAGGSRSALHEARLAAAGHALLQELVKLSLGGVWASFMEVTAPPKTGDFPKWSSIFLGLRVLKAPKKGFPRNKHSRTHTHRWVGFNRGTSFASRKVAMVGTVGASREISHLHYLAPQRRGKASASKQDSFEASRFTWIPENTRVLGVTSQFHSFQGSESF